MEDVLVIGGGAAGLMAAITAADLNKSVTLIEKNAKVGRKLMITGKGRCNVTNNCDVSELIKNVPKNASFLYSAFNAFTSADTVNFFQNLNVPLKTERGNRVFPVSDKASDIVDALFYKLKKSGVKIVNSAAVKIEVNGENVKTVTAENGEKYFGKSVIIATGGKSYPLTGSTGDGYKFAVSLGHTVTKLSPSLCALNVKEGFVTLLAGLSLKNVALSIYENGIKKPVFTDMGEMLFTHTGISGPMVLSGSAHLRNMDKSEYTAVIDMKPALSEQQLDKRLIKDFSLNGNKELRNVLTLLLPKSLINPVLMLSNADGGLTANQVDIKTRQSIANTVKGIKLRILSFAPIEEAIVTSGGVNVKEVNPKTMESKIVSGVFFAGEILDVDAYTGGFNLQTAFSTGFLAGQNA